MQPPPSCNRRPSCEHVFVPYVELHCHSAFSFLDGASLPDELVPRALELGYGTMALTDHNTVSGSMEFAVCARALGLRPIHGAEIDLDDGRHLTLLVENANGWSSLCRILTHAHAHTREQPGPASDPHVPLRTVLDHAPGLVCLSGCALRGVQDEATLARLREAFGQDNLRVELQRPFLQGDRARNRGLERLAERLGVATVATGNVHAHAPERALLQDAFVAVRLHTTLDASEPQRRGNHSHVLASPETMADRFAEHPEAVAETELLADRLRFDLRSDLGYRYPGAEDADATRKLSELCQSRLQARYDHAPGPIRDQASARLQEELRIIEALGLPGFFLLHHDLLELAREVAQELRGPDTRARSAPSRPGPGLERVLDRLLPDRALPRRSDRQRAADRALSERGADLAAGHRPRLPAGHSGKADPPRARALRPRTLGPGGCLSHIPGPGRDPGAGQGAGAAPRRDRAGGPRQRGLGRPDGGSGHQDGL